MNPPSPLRILHLEDDPNDAALVLTTLKAGGFECATICVETEDDFLATLARGDIDLILSDFSLPAFDGLSALKIAHAERPDLPLIFVSGTLGEESAIDSLKRGATDYVLKDDLGRLVPAVRRAIQEVEASAAKRRAEESLMLFRTLLDRSNDAIEVVDAETGRFLDVNETGCQRLGYSRDEMLSMGLADIIDAGGRPFSLQVAVEETRKTGFRIIESRHRRKDGSTFPVEINVQYSDLNRGYLISVVRDITDRKRTEARVHRLIDSNTQGVIFWDKNGDVTGANDAFLQMVHQTREELELGGINWTAMTPPEYAHLDRRALDEIAAKGTCAPYEKEFLLRDGSRVPVLLGAAAFEDNPEEGVCFLLDLTESKRTMQQIAEQAAVLDKARDAILVTDLKGVISFWNKGAERIYGWTREEAVGRKMDAIYAHPEKFKETFAIVLAKGELSDEAEHITKERSHLTVEVRRTLILDNEGRPKSILSINTDISEKKKIEAQFMRAQRMESIGTLAGGVAHDLNNILAPIMMSIDILKTMTESPQAMTILETIEVSAKRGADIVRQVLSFARGVEGERVEVQPSHLLKDLESIIKDTFPKGIRLQFSAPNDTWVVLGDPTQMHQVLLNLCVNARDAMPNGGTLTIGVENWVIDEQYAAMHLEAKPGRYVKISVTDSGMGIPPGLLDKIFEPFFTTKELNKGTGLGLSTVMAIVKSHGGIINVYSEPGKGTTFAVYLPAMELSPDALKKQSQLLALPRGNGQTVLVIDDEVSILIITSQTLEAFGYRALTATDGADALAIYLEHKHEIAVVLTDMMMPVMDGPSTIKALMRINPKVKIVAASGLKANDDVAKASAEGVKHFLMKPYTARTLLKSIWGILNEA